MRRIHAIEILDLPGCPQLLRDAGTDYLEFMEDRGNVYGSIAPRLAHALEKTGHTRVLDLCSGGAGPWHKLLPALEAKLGDEVELRLSDLYPNELAFARARERSKGRIGFTLKPVDVMDVPEGATGFRTMFSAFHHFRPDQAREILASAVRDKAPIAVFEATQRHVLPMLPVLLSPLVAWLVTPFIRPFRWSRLLFTYLIPIIPLIIVFDGLVSCLRTYSTSELDSLVAEIDAPEYTWEIGVERFGSLPVGVTYLIGYPSAEAA